MAGAYAVSNFEGAHGRHRAELMAKFSDDCRARWRDEFVRFLPLPEGNAAQDFHRSGRGNWEASVFTLNPTAALLQSGNINALYSEGFHTHARAHNVSDGIEGANLVKMDFLGCGAMNFGLSDSNPRENRQCVLFDKRRKRTGFDQRFDMGVRALW